MILFGHGGDKFKASLCKKPKMRDVRGRTWDSVIKTIDSVTREFYLDTTWGRNLYFMYDGNWYKVSLDGDAYDTDCLYTNKDLKIDEDKVNKDIKNIELYYTLWAWGWTCYRYEDENYTLDELWSKMIEDYLDFSHVKILKNLNELKNIILNPSESQVKIIKQSGVSRKNEILQY